MHGRLAKNIEHQVTEGGWQMIEANERETARPHVGLLRQHGIIEQGNTHCPLLLPVDPQKNMIGQLDTHRMRTRRK